ncbi:multidrug ABC transporter ATP-binding protein, partial [Octadecabacter sp.]|nr:multidrug ABC transporter ATP-binding protein [Octadecabacter sp.]
MNDISLQCNAANLFRWRAHYHLIKQSVGWFQEDLAGRTASRLVLMGNYATNVIFHSLNAVAFGLVYMIGVVS